MKLDIPKKTNVFEDKVTGVKTMAMRIQFPDFTEGILSVTKLNRSKWNPIDDVKSIIINFQNHDNQSATKDGAAKN
jgi:hypothetical protein